MTPRRLYAPVVLGTLAAGGLAFFALGRTWVRGTVVAEGLSSEKVTATGSDAHPLASALSLVIVASALAVLAASRRVRRVVGVLTVIVALVALSFIVFASGAVDDTLKAAVEKSPSFTGGNLPGDTTRTAWSWVAIAAFVLAAVLGAVTTRFAAVWPTMGSRYDAPPVRPGAQAEHDDNDMWKALDEGRDPTQ
ncbi:hypothetical protein GCM10022234_34810 [Aeromicrobium panaciterrae]|uniref:Trp biosynthesis-associated membrane protein n=1 Tax=Aeromicrobium panaciterrae TaxID=363861 RepID=UPI0031D10AE5